MGRVGRPVGLMQFDIFTIKEVLSVLAKRERMRFNELARELRKRKRGWNSGTIVRYLRLLVYNKCIERVEHSRFAVEYRITERGLELLDALKVIEKPNPEKLERAFE